MPRPARTWVTTDWHLHHQRLVEAGERPAGFELSIMNNHRELVREQDTLVHLGDVIFYRMDTLAEILAQLPGRKILVLGNHDRKSRSWYERNGFHYAADLIVLGDVAFSHRPLSALPDGASINVHGHLHTHREHESKQAWHRLVALELTDYRPVLLDSLR